MRCSGVILAGGESWRMKPYMWIPKPLVELADGVTLLEWQVARLKTGGVDEIVVVSRDFKIPELDVSWVFSKPEWGTGGALKRALDHVTSDTLYVLNCDDIIFDSAESMISAAKEELERRPERNIVIAVARARLPFGVVRLRHLDRYPDELPDVREFSEKPELNMFVSCGHYIWRTESARMHTPDSGDLERTCLPLLAKARSAAAYLVRQGWITINTYKDLVEARKIFNHYRGEKKRVVSLV